MDAGFMLPPGKMGVAQKIVKLVRELQKLEREFLNFENESFSPATPTLNIGVLKTNQKHIELFVSFRFTPQILQKQIDLWWHKLETECGLIDIHFVPERVSPAALTPLESPLVQGALTTAKKLSLPEKPITKASGTECSVYRKYEIDCIVFGPGVSIGNSHTANEYNILKQLDLATEFYIEMAKRFCL
jgi:succinyl-diaminopimelate desuccinylase